MIVADEKIPQVLDAFSDLGEVKLLPGRQIARKHLQDCRCLVVRTVTQIDQNLLQNTPVEFVGTATIGTDHVDLDYLEQNNIAFANAAGCNAEAASEYVISGLFALSERKEFDPFTLKAGIIGCGNVGSRLLQKLQALGIETLVNDPPLEAAQNRSMIDLDTILSECNFISLHVPLTRDGDHPTWHLLDRARLQRLTRDCILVNTARGPVIDNAALLEILDQRPDLTIFLDTWENEPNISRTLLQKVDLAAPHIAGYSVEGRLRGTQMILDAACRHFSANSNWRMESLLPEPIKLEIRSMGSDSIDFQKINPPYTPVEQNQSSLTPLITLFRLHHDIWQDHDALIQSAQMSDAEFATHFDSLRKVYPQRFEYERYRLTGIANKKATAIARELLFQ
ncbi:MAG: 4-phosphoerythronate dehydrogenase [Proteobacteria bacterium]|nr:4-phosphoerythronate dehydrogenase [Pseudomonadota bacterium]